VPRGQAHGTFIHHFFRQGFMPPGEINKGLHGFVKDLVVLIQERNDESLAESERPTAGLDVTFRDGLNMASYDILGLIKSQPQAFGYAGAAAGVIVPEFGRPVSGAA
jgi:hypothetical protein